MMTENARQLNNFRKVKSRIFDIFENDNNITIYSGSDNKNFSTCQIAIKVKERVKFLYKNGIYEGTNVLISMDDNIQSIIDFLALLYVQAVPFSIKKEQIKDINQTFLSKYSKHIIIDGNLHSQYDNNFKQKSLQRDLVLVQFTSGTLSKPKGVPITGEMLYHNLESLRSFCVTEKKEVTLNVLPLSHDMGLIGAFLTSMYTRSDFIHYDIGSLLRNPRKFLDTIACVRPTAFSTTDFILDYISRFIKFAPKNCFDGVKLFIGAEPIRREVLYKLLKFRSYLGFREDNIHLCYGLAEAVLLVTGRRCSSLEESFVYDARKARYRAKLGRPLGTEVQIGRRDSSGIGDIVISGKNVFSGYLTEDGLERAAFDGGFFNTGDRGYIDSSGELVFCGRAGESLSVNARNIFFDDIELKIRNELDLEIICSSLDDQLFVLVKFGQKFEPEKIANLIKVTFGILPKYIKTVHKSMVKRSSAGKIKRSETLKYVLGVNLNERMSS